MSILLALSFFIPLIINSQDINDLKPTGESFTTTEIVRGVVFYRGPLADAIGVELNLEDHLDPDSLKVANQIEDALLTSMVENNPDLIADYILEMRSGNPYRAEQAINGLNDLLRTTIKKELPDFNIDNYEPTVCGPNVCGAAIVLFALAGNVIAAANFNVIGRFNIVYNENGLWNVNGTWTGRSMSVANHLENTTFVERTTLLLKH